MSEFRPIVVNLLLVGLLIIAMITMGLNIASNNPSQSIGNDPTLSAYANSLNATLYNATDDASASEQAITNSSITLTSGFPVFDSISGVWKTIKKVPVAVFNLTIGLVRTRLGSSFWVVLGVIGAILTITILLAVWKLVSTGEGG